jgi:CMP-N,N'-diacetyllegionaminic acid synthase
MYKSKKILVLIPARGGSKGLPRKNIKELAGKELIGWSIEQGLNSSYVDYVHVSTEDEEIANISRSFGAELLFMRPQKLAEDTSSTMDVVVHVIEELKSRGKFFDIVALLEPTSPLRKRQDIDLALKALIDNEDNADSVVSLGEVHLENPFITKVINNGKVESFVESSSKIFQRQQYPKIYFPYGVIYATKTEVLLAEKTFYPKRTIPYFIERWQNYEIDDLCDFICIESIIKKYKESVL